MINRLYNLDYLRGIAAFGIMLYHYLSWTTGSFTSDYFIGRVGIYGVSIFYVLSGLTLYHVYYSKIEPSIIDIISFFKKRILRIFPLLWLVTILSILLSRQTPDSYKLFLNLSGLFGFIKWDAYFAVGAWSIGNELFFYIFFPIFVFLSKKQKILMFLISLCITFFYIYFAFSKLSNHLPLEDQWFNYINPLNQIFLFLGGFFIGTFFNNMIFNKTTLRFLFLLGISIFVFYPAKGDTVNIVTDINRLIFTASCFLICFCFYKSSLTTSELTHRVLKTLGETSYSIYLIHPITFELTKILLSSNQSLNHLTSIQLLLSLLATLLASYFTYQYFEKYFIQIGHQKV